MRVKSEEKQRALELRKQGLSYSEIQKVVHVSRSSLSLWLPEVHLKKWQKARLREKLIVNQKLGAEAKRKQRIEKTNKINKEAVAEIRQIENRELFYMGVMLYWAEGTKSRGKYLSQGVDFSNSDPRMCKLFLKWLLKSLKVPISKIGMRIYIHESQKARSNEVLTHWAKISGFSKNLFNRTCFTKTVYPRKRKREDNGHYYGQLRIRVRKSTDLNRRIAGWVDGICLRSGV